MFPSVSRDFIGTEPTHTGDLLSTEAYLAGTSNEPAPKLRSAANGKPCLFVFARACLSDLRAGGAHRVGRSTAAFDVVRPRPVTGGHDGDPGNTGRSCFVPLLPRSPGLCLPTAAALYRCARLPHFVPLPRSAAHAPLYTGRKVRAVLCLRWRRLRPDPRARRVPALQEFGVSRRRLPRRSSRKLAAPSYRLCCARLQGCRVRCGVCQAFPKKGPKPEGVKREERQTVSPNPKIKREK